jgi:ABC-type glutathione transport system ATPase component
MISIRDLSVTYRRNGSPVPAVKGCSLEIPSGEVTAIVGESGSGKSTLLMALMRLLPPGTAVTGSVSFNGVEVLQLEPEPLRKFRWEKMALVLQGAMHSFTPVLSLGRQIAEVLEVHRGTSRKEALDRAGTLLNETGLPSDFRDRYPHEISGGQKQRAAIAMALACEPDFLLADEPTTALDVITQAEIVQVLAELVRTHGLGLVMVTHDLALASGLAHRLVVMYEGEIVEEGTPEEIIGTPRHPHTKDLVGSLKRMEGKDHD